MITWERNVSSPVLNIEHHWKFESGKNPAHLMYICGIIFVRSWFFLFCEILLVFHFGHVAWYYVICVLGNINIMFPYFHPKIELEAFQKYYQFCFMPSHILYCDVTFDIKYNSINMQSRKLDMMQFIGGV